MYRKSFRSESSGFRGRGRFKRSSPHRQGQYQHGTRIDVTKFINKATPITQAEDYVPQYKFADFAINEKLKKNILDKGYTKPSAIQDKAIPHILNGKDVIGIANTGTGKTAAFLVPLINKVLNNRQERILIVAPTRELALQIQDEFFAFSRFLNMYCVTCIGGASMRNQIYNLRRNNNFIIGTPGRLKDLVQRKILNLAGFRNVVLDEADRMLDMGFINDIKFLLAQLPRERQTLFFSATLSPEIEMLTRNFLNQPVKISVKIQDTSSNVDQDVIRVSDREQKMNTLHDLLIKKEFGKVLIFGKTKHGVEKLSRMLAQRGFRAESIHGNKSQSQRQKALALFRDSRIQVLVATDVAARGLDIADVTHVINFDLPATYEDYIHRIGRTGRANKKGVALTFVG